MKEQKEYNIFSNYIYALKMAKQSSKLLFWIIIGTGIIGVVLTLIQVYLPKMVLSLVEKKVSTKVFVTYIIVVGIMIIFLYVARNVSWQSFDTLYKKTNGFLNKKRMNKIYETDFKNMESPDFLDCVQKAKNALNYGFGFHGILYESRNLISQIMVVIISVVILGTKNIIVMFSICILSVVTSKVLSYTTKIDKKKFTDFMSPTYRKIGYLERTTKNFDFAKDIRIFSMQKIFTKEFENVNETFVKNNLTHHNRWILCNFSMESVVLIQKIMMYVWLVYMVIMQNMLISDFVLYIGLVTALTDAIGFLLWIFSNIKLNTFMINDYRNLIEWKEEKNTYQKNDSCERIKLESYEFKFENVSFKYPGQENYILKNINLTISDGMKLAIVGVNGAGKTTFIKLLLRLYEPNEGRILLNGEDVRTYNREQYFKFFAPVFQNVECFAMPIYQNISFKNQEKTDMKKIEQVLKQSGLKEKIDMYKKGVFTNLLKIFDKKGIDLSGGERQKLAMARALYKGGDVVILDEPTAALDALAEDRMYRQFKEITNNRTCLFISHRLGSTQFCDNIVLFENGQIVEEGTHEELLKKDGKYAYMYNIQSQYYKEEY